MFNKKLALASVSAAIMFGSLAMAAATTSGTSPLMEPAPTSSSPLDAALNKKVETLLRTDIGLTGSRIKVHGNGGLIVVGGTVPDEYSLRRALDLASGVGGVREVHNEMEIAVPK